MDRLQLYPIEIDPTSFLYEHCALPSLPKVLTNFQEAVQNEDVSISRVVGIISSDQSIVAEVLKVVNSAYYSLPREVSRVDMAVAYLGIKEVHNIVLASSVINTFNVNEPGEFKKLWHHSIYTALCTRYLANRYERHLAYGDLWAPALLHDIGKLVYLKFFTDHYKALRRYAGEKGCLFDEVTEVHGLPSSAYLGALLCDRWRLPHVVKQVCAVQGPGVLLDGSNGVELKPIHRMVLLGDLVATLATDPLVKEKQLDITRAVMKDLELTEAEFLILMGALSDLKLEADKMAG